MQIDITVEKMLAPRPEKKWYYFRAVMGGNGVPETSVICKGRMSWEPQPLETLALIGEWVVYRGERQFQFKTAKLTLPLDPRAQLHYVCQRAKGIGIAIEQALVVSSAFNKENDQRSEISKRYVAPSSNSLHSTIGDKSTSVASLAIETIRNTSTLNELTSERVSAALLSRAVTVQ